MNIRDFKTQSNYIPRKNVTVEGYWPIAIDIGYSGVKAFSPNSILCFPSFARKRDAAIIELGKPRQSDILYEDDDGIWNVGEMANNSIHSADVNDSLNTLYSRYRYDNPMFRVLSNVGMAMCMQENSVATKADNDQIIIQSGLPSKYKDADTDALRESLCGRRKFKVKFGRKDWESYDFEINPDDIGVMQQPLGAYFSASMDKMAHITELGRNLLRNWETVLLDGGFGTIDACRISARTYDVTDNNTFPNQAMLEIFNRTVKEIEKKYGTEIAVHALQPYLASGRVPVVDRKYRSKKDITFDEILYRHAMDVGREALDKMELAYDHLIDANVLLTAGGLSAVWEELIAERYKNMEGLQIIKSGSGDNLPEIYDIVRGYYLYSITSLRKR